MRCITRLLQAKYRMTLLELVGILKSCPSMLARINAPPKKKSLLYHTWSLVSHDKLSSVIMHGLVMLL